MVRKVAVIMGSDSDWPVVKGACAQLKALDIPFEAHILSAHRTPAGAAEFAKSARANGFGVILCAAGMAAHLAGAFAANTTLPVIGIPMKGGAMDGMDALLATVQMPSGIPVATVALNGAKNAAWLWPKSWQQSAPPWPHRSLPKRKSCRLRSPSCKGEPSPSRLRRATSPEGRGLTPSDGKAV